jgi:nicotinate-nucleotide pyrophosphorylase (carboxylating)
MDLSPLVLHGLITRLLEEDVGYGDITTLATVPPQARGHGRFLAKEALVLAGLEVALAVFHTVDSTVRVDSLLGALLLKFTDQPVPCSRLSG